MRLKRRPRRRPYRFYLLFLVLIILFFAIYVSKEPEKDEPSHIKEAVKHVEGEEPVKAAGYDPGKIMVVLPLSGLLKDEGFAARRGIELALEDAGLSFSVLYVDWEQEDFDLIGSISDRSFGVFFAQLPFRKIQEMAKARPDALIIAPASSHAGLKELPQVFSLLDTDDEEGRFVASLLNDVAAGEPCFSVMVEPYEYGKLLYSAFAESADSKSACYKTFEVGQDPQNLDEKIRSLVLEKPKVVWLCGSPEWINRMYPRILDYGYSGFFMVPSYFDQHMAREIPPHYLERFIFVRPCIGDPDNDTWASFFDRFKRKFLRAPEWIDSLFYDATVLYTLYVKNLQERDAKPEVTIDGFREFLRSRGCFDGVSGRVCFSGDGRVCRSFHLAVFRNGMFIPVQDSICNGAGLRNCSGRPASTSGNDR